MKLLTIGFTKKSAEVFFTELQVAGVTLLADVRLNNIKGTVLFPTSLFHQGSSNK